MPPLGLSADVVQTVTQVTGVVVGLLGVAAGSSLVFKRGRRLYDFELGGVEMKLKEPTESAARLDAVALEERAREVEQRIAQLLRAQTDVTHDAIPDVPAARAGPAALADEVASRIAALIREE